MARKPLRHYPGWQTLNKDRYHALPVRSPGWRLLLALIRTRPGFWNLVVVSSHYAEARAGRLSSGWGRTDSFRVVLHSRQGPKLLWAGPEEVCRRYAEEISRLRCDP